jgi:hypothetical protein
MKHQPEINSEIVYKFNIINVMRLRDHLTWIREKESSPQVGFNMSLYYGYTGNESSWDKSEHKCETVACLAGHAVLLSLSDKEKIFPLILGNSQLSITSRAKDWLGISPFEASYLFNGNFSSKKLIRHITLDETIAVLDHMIETGHVHLLNQRVSSHETST